MLRDVTSPANALAFAGERPGVDDGGAEITDELRIQGFERAAEREKGAVGFALVDLHLERTDSVLLEFLLNVLECPRPDGGACPRKEDRIGNRLIESPLLLLDQLDRFTCFLRESG